MQKKQISFRTVPLCAIGIAVKTQQSPGDNSGKSPPAIYRVQKF